MKTLIKTRAELLAVGRWDIDFHLPAMGVKQFAEGLLRRVDAVADIATEKRDPTNTPDTTFKYIDIASVDVATGMINNPQDLTGEEAPSRARKVVRAFDVIISTCRPTRGAIAVVPVELHDNIASTAFSVVRAKPEINPFYLHYALRLESTQEQFRKWSTGSSYPAILDDDVRKTLIPVPDLEEQDRIAIKIMKALKIRSEAIQQANSEWDSTLTTITEQIQQKVPTTLEEESSDAPAKASDIACLLKGLPPLTSDIGGRRKRNEESSLVELFA